MQRTCANNAKEMSLENMHMEPSSAKPVALSGWQFCYQETLGKVPRHFWLSQLRGGVTGISWVEDRDAATSCKAQGCSHNRVFIWPRAPTVPS